MLTFLVEAIDDSCHLLLLVLGVLSFLSAINWAFKKVKAFRALSCFRKTRGKTLAAGMTSLEVAKVSKRKRITEQRSNEDQSLYHTLCTLDRSYMYLARKVKDLSGQISRSASYSSVESVTSICGSSRLSARRPPSLTPAALDRVAEGGHPRRDTGRPAHVRRRIPFLGYKVQELLEWHVHRKRRENDAPTSHKALRIEEKVQTDTIKVQQGGAVQWVSQQLPPCQRASPQAILQACRTTNPMHSRSPEPRPWPPEPSHKDVLPSTILICPSQSHSSLRAMTAGKRGSGSPKKEITEVICLLEQSKIPPAREPRRPGTPKKEITEVVCLLEQSKIPPAREPRRPGTPKKEITEVVCLLEQSKIPPAREPRRPGTPKKELTEVVCLLEQSKIPSAREPRRPGTPKKEITEAVCLLEQSKIPLAREPRRPGTPKKELTEVVCLLEQSKIPSAREPRRPGTPKKEITEVLCLLEQSKIPLAREPRRSETPKEREKERRSSSRRPSTPKEALGKGNSPKDRALDVEISMMLDQKTRRLSWAEAVPEVPKASEIWAEPASARPQLRHPTFMCQDQLEMPCVATAQIELRQESQKFVQPLARAIVESLDKEQAMRDVHLCLAASVERGRGWTFVEYPVCLLCGRCTSSCPHPRPRHNPSLLVCPRFSLRDCETHMALSFMLKVKRQEAERFGLVPVVELSKSSRGREPPSKLGRSQSKHRKGPAVAAAPQPRAPERKKRGRDRAAAATAEPRAPERSKLGRDRAAAAEPQAPERSKRGRDRAAAESWAAERAPRPVRHSAEAVDLKARGQGAVPLVPKDSFISAAERSQRHSNKPAGAEAGPVQTKPAKSSPNIFKEMCLCLKKAWAKMCGKERMPPTKPAPPQVAGVPSNDLPASETQARRGILRQASFPATESLTELAAPAPAMPGAPHGRRRVSLQVAEPKSSRPPKKGDRRQPKSAASKKPRRRK